MKIKHRHNLQTRLTPCINNIIVYDCLLICPHAAVSSSHGKCCQ